MSNAIRLVLNPGIRLMRRLRLAPRLLLLGLVLWVPLTYLAMERLRTVTDEAQVVQRQIAGSALLAPLLAVGEQLVEHRRQTRLLLAGEDDAKRDRAHAEQRMAEALKTFDGEVAKNPLLKLADARRALDSVLATLPATGQFQDNGPQALARHAEALQALQQLLDVVNEASGMLYSAQPSLSLLADMAAERAMPLMSQIAQIQEVAAAALAAGKQAAEATHVRTLMAHAQENTAALARRMDQLRGAGTPLPEGWSQARADFDALIAVLHEDFAATRTGVPSPQQVDSGQVSVIGSRAVGRLSTVMQKLAVDLHHRYVAHNEEVQRRRDVTVGLLLVGSLLLAYLMLCFYLSVMGALKVMSRAVTTLSHGDFSLELKMRGRDEFAQLGTDLERMVTSLSKIVAIVRSDAVLVSAAGAKVAESSEDLATRTKAQSANLVQTTQAVLDVSRRVATNASAAQEADVRMEALRHSSEQGGQTMTQAVETMGQIETGARRVSDIVASIDAIASQTNLLSLNAAVEAARAGEQGKGFAVVAAEVRKLAQRAAQAAGEIKGLIGTSREQAGQGAHRVGLAATELRNLVKGVDEVASRLRGISEASLAQSSALGQVTGAIDQLDEITRTNARKRLSRPVSRPSS